MGWNEPHKGSGLLRIYNVRYEELRNLPSALFRIPGKSGKRIKSSEMRPGDLVFYGKQPWKDQSCCNVYRKRAGHQCGEPPGRIKISTWNYRTPICIVDVIGNRS